jgi:hypothetical protein
MHILLISCKKNKISWLENEVRRWININLFSPSYGDNRHAGFFS